MRAFDEVVDRFGARIDRMPRRTISQCFAIIGRGLLPDCDRWDRHVAHGQRGLIADAFRTIDEFVSGGGVEDGAQQLLERIELFTPNGQSPDDFPSTWAQDCWICVDTALRVALDEALQPGSCIEYALQPISESVSERLFGFTQVPSGPSEDASIDDLLGDPVMIEACQFLDRLLEALSSGPVGGPKRLPSYPAPQCWWPRGVHRVGLMHAAAAASSRCGTPGGIVPRGRPEY